MESKKTLPLSDELAVRTPIGILEARKATDENFPGIVVSVDGIDLVLVEYNLLDDKHRVVIWDEKKPESDFIYKRDFEAQ